VNIGPIPWRIDGPHDVGPAVVATPRVMIVRTPDERLMFLRAIASHRKDAFAGSCPAHLLAR
jgi:hypothetical protein